MIQSQCHGFMPPQAAREQQCEQCSVADFVVVRVLRECGFRFMTDGLHATDQ